MLQDVASHRKGGQGGERRFSRMPSVLFRSTKKHMPRRGQDDEQAQEEGTGSSDHDAPLTSPLGKGEWGGGVSEGSAVSRKFWPGCWGVPQPKLLGSCVLWPRSAFVPAVCEVIVREHL